MERGLFFEWRNALWQRCKRRHFPTRFEEVIGRGADRPMPSQEHVAAKIMAAFGGKR